MSPYISKLRTDQILEFLKKDLGDKKVQNLEFILSQITQYKNIKKVKRIPEVYRNELCQFILQNQTKEIIARDLSKLIGKLLNKQNFEVAYKNWVMRIKRAEVIEKAYSCIK